MSTYFSISFLLLTHLLRAQPTTLSEYTFITTGYKTQLETGVNLMAEYTLSDSFDWNLKKEDSASGLALRALYREAGTTPCAIMAIYQKKEFGELVDTEYFCIPTPDANSLWQMTLKQLRESADKSNSTQKMEAMVWAMMNFTSLYMKDLDRAILELPPPKGISVLDDLPLAFVEVMPVYPGGETAMRQDIMENAIYPSDFLEKNISGKVYVRFIVENDGSVSNVRVVRHVPGAPELNQVAIDAISQLKTFTPGKQNGLPVRVEMTYPVSFIP